MCRNGYIHAYMSRRRSHHDGPCTTSCLGQNVLHERCKNKKLVAWKKYWMCCMKKHKFNKWHFEYQIFWCFFHAALMRDSCAPHAAPHAVFHAVFHALFHAVFHALLTVFHALFHAFFSCRLSCLFLKQASAEEAFLYTCLLQNCECFLGFPVAAAHA